MTIAQCIRDAGRNHIIRDNMLLEMDLIGPQFLSLELLLWYKANRALQAVEDREHKMEVNYNPMWQRVD